MEGQLERRQLMRTFCHRPACGSFYVIQKVDRCSPVKTSQLSLLFVSAGHIAKSHEHAAEQQVGNGIARRQSDGFLQFLSCILILSEGCVAPTKVITSCSVLRPVVNTLLVSLHGI